MGGLCCETASWKREQIAEHKFDFVDVLSFVENSWIRKIRYSFVYLLTFKVKTK